MMNKQQNILLLKKNIVDNSQNKAWVEERADAINRVFSEFNYRAKVGGYVEGPAVTLFLIDIEPGTDVSKINSYTKTLTMRLRTKSLRIQDPIPGLDCAGIEIPNENRAVVLAGNLINNPKFLPVLPSSSIYCTSDLSRAAVLIISLIKFLDSS